MIITGGRRPLADAVLDGLTLLALIFPSTGTGEGSRVHVPDYHTIYYRENVTLSTFITRNIVEGGVANKA